MGLVEQKNNVHELIEQYNKRRVFIESTPIGSLIWSDATKKFYGTTDAGRVYKDIYDLTVQVKDVNDIPGSFGVWNWQDVIPKT